MCTSNVNDGFGGAVDNLLLSIDLESRGCHLVSPARSIASETEHMNVISKLKTLLETPVVDASGIVPVIGSEKKLSYGGVKDIMPQELLELPLTKAPDAPEYRDTRVLHHKDSKENSPIGSNMSMASDHSPASMKRDNRARVLKHAEAVIEYQRERINSLEAAITKFNAAIGKTNALYKQELQRYGDENLELRQELQKVVTEFDVLSKRYHLDLGEAASMKKKLSIINYDLTQKDNEIVQLKDRLCQLPQENEQLKEKIILMSGEIERLNREIRGLNLLDVKVASKATPMEIAVTTKACAAQHDKLKASSKCIAQLENDIQSYKRVVESQSIEIKRLNYKLQKMRTEKQPGNYMVSAQKQMLQIRSIFTQLAKQISEQKPQPTENPVERDLENRSLYAACSLRTSVEFREMYDKLLDVVSRNMSRKSSDEGIYSMMVNYSRDAIQEELQVQIDESVLTFYRVDDDRSAEFMRISLNSLLGVKKSVETNEFCFYTKDSAVHIIGVSSRDKFNRLYYALQYAGFITEHVRFSIFSKIDYNWIPVDCSWPPFSAVVSTAEAAFTGEVPSNVDDVARVISDIYIITDPMERLITLDNAANALVVMGPQMSSAPFIVQCDSAFAVRLCHPANGECDCFELVEPPVATLSNGAPTNDYFLPSRHTFALVLTNNRVVFVNALDGDNERRLLKILRKVSFRSYHKEEEPQQDAPIDEGPPVVHSQPVGSGTMPPLAQSELADVVAKESSANKVYELIGNILFLYMNEEEPIKVSNTDGCFRVNEEKMEVAISSGVNETYVLSFATIDALRKFVHDLEIHGFTVNVDVEQQKQVCIVTEGCLQLFKDANEEPLITFNNTDTTVSIKESQREIQISQFKGKMVKMTLDCTSPAEFRRWKFALSFAGFIKSNMATKPGNALNKFIFPIKIFDDDKMNERRAFQVESNRIYMYVNPTAQDPFIIFDKSNIDLELYDDERRMRLYVSRNSKSEERFDFVLAMLADYEALKASLKAHKYAIKGSKKTKGVKYHFILSKPGSITVHRTKYDTEPQLILDRKCYTADVSSMRICFMTKMGMDKTITMNFKKEYNFKRWLMALKVAGFLPLTNDRVPILYLPTMGYGHVCAEIPTLLKGHLK